MQLQEDFEAKIITFTESMDHLINDMKFNNLGWKYHIIKAHLIDFLKRTNSSLGVYSEQTVEAVHKDINKTLKRFSVSDSNRSHGKKQRRMAVVYSSMRV